MVLPRVTDAMNRERASDGFVRGAVATLAVSTFLPCLDRELLGLTVIWATAATMLVAHLVYGGASGRLVDREGRTTGRMDW